MIALDVANTQMRGLENTRNTHLEKNRHGVTALRHASSAENRSNEHIHAVHVRLGQQTQINGGEFGLRADRDGRKRGSEQLTPNTLRNAVVQHSCHNMSERGASSHNACLTCSALSYSILCETWKRPTIHSGSSTPSVQDAGNTFLEGGSGATQICVILVRVSSSKIWKAKRTGVRASTVAT